MNKDEQLEQEIADFYRDHPSAAPLLEAEFTLIALNLTQHAIAAYDLTTSDKYRDAINRLEANQKQVSEIVEQRRLEAAQHLHKEVLDKLNKLKSAYELRQLNKS